MKVVLGTMTFGNQADSDTASTMLDSFAGGGLNELDTAYVYNDGKTESILGDLLPGKSWAANAIIAGKANPRGPGRLSAAGIREQLDTSLERLKRQHLDLFYLHSPDLETSIDETLEAVNEAHAQGKIKKLGLSNYAAWQVSQIYERCEQRGWLKPSCYQGMYNAITRDVERELFLCLADYNMGFYAYNPLAGGLLTGKYKNTPDLPDTGRFSYHAGYPERYWKEVNHRAVGELADVCRGADIKVAAAALRWMLHHSPLAEGPRTDDNAVIVGASNPGQLDENLTACTEGPLPTELVEALDAAWSIAQPTCMKYFRP